MKLNLNTIDTSRLLSDNEIYIDDDRYIHLDSLDTVPSTVTLYSHSTYGEETVTLTEDSVTLLKELIEETIEEEEVID